MGNSVSSDRERRQLLSPSKSSLSHPIKPFKKSRKIWKVVHPKKATTLQQLILNRDWQRVIIRVTMYPEELSKTLILFVKDISQEGLDEEVKFKLLPLHLACALNPPVEVIETMLEHHVDAAEVLLLTKKKKESANGIGILRRLKMKFKRQPQRHKKLTDEAYDESIASIVNSSKKKPEDEIGCFEDESDSFHTANEQMGRVKLVVIDDDDEESSAVSSHGSSLTSRPSWDQPERQLTVRLSLEPEPPITPPPTRPVWLNETLSTASGSSKSTASPILRVQWDLTPLYQYILHEGGLFPLHVACLYEAAPEVVLTLLQAYPRAANLSVSGMLPLHWVTAGWTLPALALPPPAARIFEAAMATDNSSSSKMKAIIAAFLDNAPDCTQAASDSHGMTPLEYIEECMEDGELKSECIEMLRTSAAPAESIHSGSYVFTDEVESVNEDVSLLNSPNHLIACISALIADRNWDSALALIEDDPTLASKWLYGVSEAEEHLTRAVWKRLPIHMACAEGAPSGLISLLLDIYPEGATIAAPGGDGSKPLHTVCRVACSAASSSVVSTILRYAPDATREFDDFGRTPLHVACQRSKEEASYAIIEMLVQYDPVTIHMLDAEDMSPADYARQNFGSDSMITEMMDTIHLFQREDEECEDIDE